MWIRWLKLALVFSSIFLLAACELPFKDLLSKATEEVSQNATEDPLQTAQPETDALPEEMDAHDLALNPCDNVFYPLVPGNQWVYRVNQEETEIAVTPDPADNANQLGITVASVENSQATLDSMEMSTGVITQTLVECENGAIKNFPLLTLSIIFGDQVNGSVNAEYQDGVFAPPQADLVSKDWIHTWEGNYLLKGNFQAQSEEDMVTLTIADSPLKLLWETEGIREPVEVPAGSFPNAIRVERDAEMNISAEFDADGEVLQVNAVLSFKNTLWYEPYVGLLKEEIHDATIKYRGMSFPVMVNGDVELIEFRPASK